MQTNSSLLQLVSLCSAGSLCNEGHALGSDHTLGFGMNQVQPADSLTNGVLAECHLVWLAQFLPVVASLSTAAPLLSACWASSLKAMCGSEGFFPFGCVVTLLGPLMGVPPQAPLVPGNLPTADSCDATWAHTSPACSLCSLDRDYAV